VRSGLQPGDMAVIGSRAQLKAGTTVTPKVIELQASGEGAR
jgi:hypothetical protein